MKVRGQIVLTEGIPGQALCSFNRPDKDRCGPEGQGPFTETDDEIHRFLRKEFFCCFSNLLLNHLLSVLEGSGLPAGRQGFKGPRVLVV
jgi:hypothetical protein